MGEPIQILNTKTVVSKIRVFVGEKFTVDDEDWLIVLVDKLTAGWLVVGMENPKPAKQDEDR